MPRFSLSRPIPFARFSVLLTALVYFGFGLTLLLAPSVIEGTGVTLTTASARTEIRAFYGGLELGLALFFVIGAIKTSWLRSALCAQACSLGLIACARLFGVIIDGSHSLMHYLLLSAELSGSLLGLFALYRLRTLDLHTP